MKVKFHLPLPAQRFLNFAWFQTIWFIAILFQYEYIWLIGLLFIGFFIASSQPVNDAALMGIIILLGIVADGALVKFGVFNFEGKVTGIIPLPLWLLAIWGAFALTLLHSLRYLSHYKRLSIILGAVFGPVSYFAGERLGAVIFGLSAMMTMLILAAMWALIFPLTLYISDQFANRRVLGSEHSA